MPSRITKFVSAIAAHVLASLPLAMTAHAEPVPADSCLSAPGSPTPAGNHWHYRIDRTSKRNCWYLRRADASSRSVPQQTNPQQASVQPPQTGPAPAAKPSVADAHAELRATNENNAPTNAPPSGTDAASASLFNATPVVATRWPELPPARQMPAASPAPASTVVAANTTPQAPAESVPAAAEPATSYFSLAWGSETILTLIAAALGAMAFAGAAALIFRQLNKTRGRAIQSTRSPIWEMTDDDRILLSDHPSVDQAEYRPQFARNVPAARNTDDDVEEFDHRPLRYARR